MEERTIAGRYELVEPYGSGWRARDTELERDVVVRLGAAADVGATALAHPHIARVFDQGEADGERYAVLEYLPGGTLAERGALSEDAARDVAGALLYAHASGVVHGSIGPDAVLFDAEGRAKLADFAGPGEPEDDVRAFGALLEAFAQTSPALGAAAAAALAGDLAGAAKALEPPEPEPATLIVPPPAARPRRRRAALVAAATVALLAAGVGAAFLATSGDSNADPTTGSLSLPIPTGSNESPSEQTEAPPPTTTARTTTEQTTTAETEPQPTTAPTTTSPSPATTTAPPPTFEPPPPTTEPPPPTTTEEPPPTTTEQATPPTTAPG